jgi:hypothetical protein
MKERMQARFAALQRELETGRLELQTLERRQAYLREAVLRISGAIQVIEELLVEEHQGDSGASPSTSDLSASTVVAMPAKRSMLA